MNTKSLTKLLYTIGKEDKDTDARIDKFITYCKRKNILYKLPSIVTRLEQLTQIRKHETTVVITTAKKLNDTIRKQIVALVHAPAHANIEEIIDTTIRGGFIVEYNNIRYDGSIARQLVALEKHLAHD